MTDGTGRFHSLAIPECWRLLRSQPIGRVAWSTADGPEVLPVTFVVHEESIVFRTSPYGSLAHLKTPQPVVFEVDSFDAANRTGWNVTVKGRSRALNHPDELGDLWNQHDLVPWASGSRNLQIVISADVVAGRIISNPVDAGHD